MGKTGLSRRTIHYYIDQKLIIPPVNEGNGYHDFTEEDVQKLFIIRKLREAGLSPNSINSYMRGFLLRISVQFCVSREQRRFIFISR